MNETKRRAIVWDIIERIAFRPSNNDRITWLSVYVKTLHKFWDMEPMWTHLALEDSFSVIFLNLKCSYSIESVDKYVVSLVNDPVDGHPCWQNHIDPAYLSKASLHSASSEYPRPQRAHLQRDIEAVLDGMLFHPRCHTHIEDRYTQREHLDPDRGGLSSHEVRIGGGIENPYIFLFHLRYQFCLVADQARRTERIRLIGLFERAIKNGQTVSPRDLCNY